jgi:putative transposase
VRSPERRSPRLTGFDYSEAGAYFVTVCTAGRRCILGNIVQGKIVLSAAGEVVQECWKEIPVHFPHVRTHAFQVMPNHVHGIVEILHKGMCRGGVSPPLSPSRGGETPPLHGVTLGNVVAFFKYQATRRINVIRETPGRKVFQRSFHDRIIREDTEYFFVEQYISLNPIMWQFDREHPGEQPLRSDELRNELRRHTALDDYAIERIIEQNA